MEESLNSGLTLSSLLSDSLLRKYFPSRFDKEILKNQMRDAELIGISLDEMAEMDVEALSSRAFSHGVLANRETESLSEGDAKSEETSDALTPEGCVSISVGGMGITARVTLQKPAAGLAPPGEREMRSALAKYGIIKGIRFDFISRLAARPIYGRPFKIAEGRLPVDGEDGKAIFHFDTSIDLSPRIGADGNVDYKALDFAKNIKAGELLCEIVPPTPGKDGFSIFGEVLPGKMGKPAEVVSGSNTQLSADGREIRAACDGQAYLKNGRVMVSRVLTVEQVDSSTGNIVFVGTVQVQGDVAPGFCIRAGGDILVKGVAENASLIAGGNIVLCGGIKGKGSGSLEAGGDIRTLFIESASAHARSIYANTILNSTVDCVQTISLSGANGCLQGGSCTAGLAVRAVQIGNNANIPTYICLKDTGAFDADRAQLNLAKARYAQTVDKLLQIADMAASVRDPTEAQTMISRIVIVKQRLELEIKKLEAMQNRDGFHGRRRVVVAREHLYPNVTIEIDGAGYKSRSIRNNCAAIKEDDEIRFYPARVYG